MDASVAVADSHDPVRPCVLRCAMGVESVLQGRPSLIRWLLCLVAPLSVCTRTSTRSLLTF